MNHPIIEDLLWRHTTKKYDNTRKIPQADLDVFLEALRLTASSINSQPWKFVVLASDAAKARMKHTFGDISPLNQQHVIDGSHVILFGNHPRYSRDDYAAVVDQDIKVARTRPENRDAAFGACVYVEKNTDSHGSTSSWTKAQTYIALGNALHTLARLKIDSTPMEGLDAAAVTKEFAKELDGHECSLALVIGYHHPEGDFNAKLSKSRKPFEQVFTVI
ncbi:NAD(P)H-dependent oxidoreductase [Mariprofundus ferrooxydans]|uniref:Nitroreductase family protein n=1 Tax=Mariprofundus ferrooxydans PV-1 TaxID=314345 RepID=Q0F1A7_9PROT|nr:NAD(P)H-dependent oxidoreductase [Mariprofundus ferrooxydans]EAU55284.1 nitroreductase family protein [Mariprofundus ferrooxydans PV-1]KON47199.1 NAD(P)H-flavin oxidoreductase [Mariprofundus ferrooxydans]